MRIPCYLSATLLAIGWAMLPLGPQNSHAQDINKLPLCENVNPNGGPPTLAGGIPTDIVAEVEPGEVCSENYVGHFFYCVSVPEQDWKTATINVTSWEECWVYDADRCCNILKKRKVTKPITCRVPYFRYRSVVRCKKLELSKAFVDRHPDCTKCGLLPRLDSVLPEKSNGEAGGNGGSTGTTGKGCCPDSDTTKTKSTPTPATSTKTGPVTPSPVELELKRQVESLVRLNGSNK